MPYDVLSRLYLALGFAQGSFQQQLYIQSHEYSWSHKFGSFWGLYKLQVHFGILVFKAQGNWFVAGQLQVVQSGSKLVHTLFHIYMYSYQTEDVNYILWHFLEYQYSVKSNSIINIQFHSGQLYIFLRPGEKKSISHNFTSLPPLLFWQFIPHNIL